MKKMLGTIVLFILLIITVVALTKLGGFSQKTTTKTNASATSNRVE